MQATFLATPGNLVITVLLTQDLHLSTLQFGVVSLQAAYNPLQVVDLPTLNHHCTPRSACRTAENAGDCTVGLARKAPFSRPT